MCAVPGAAGHRRRRTVAVSLLAATLITVSSCASEQRTGTNFCRRLGEALPDIGQPMTTQGDILEQVSRYERLLEVAPLSIEEDFAALTDLLRRASRVDTDDPAQLQALADATYAANRASKNVAAWVVDTCAVDIATGLTVAPPRVPVTTVPATSTTLGEVAPDPGATSVPTG